jgi:hypothetical protein
VHSEREAGIWKLGWAVGCRAAAFAIWSSDLAALLRPIIATTLYPPHPQPLRPNNLFTLLHKHTIFKLSYQAPPTPPIIHEEPTTKTTKLANVCSCLILPGTKSSIHDSTGEWIVALTHKTRRQKRRSKRQKQKEKGFFQNSVHRPDKTRAIVLSPRKKLGRISQHLHHHSQSVCYATELTLRHESMMQASDNTRCFISFEVRWGQNHLSSFQQLPNLDLPLSFPNAL